MVRRILSAIPLTILAVIFIILLAVLFLAVFLNPSSWVVILLCFTAASAMAVFCALNAGRRMKETVTLFSDEVSDLTVDLADKKFNGVTNETRPFYDALTKTRRVLDKKGRNRQELLEIVNSVASHMEITQLLRELLPKLNEATGSCCSAFYSVNNITNKLEIKHSVGFSKNVYSEFDMNLGEGLIGQAAVKREITFYRDIPDDTVYFIRTFLGKMKPRSLMIVPVISQDVTAGVLVCASIHDYSQDDRDVTELIRHYVSVAVSNSSNFEKNKRLTNELTFQNKLIQEQHEQMKALLDEKAEWLNALLRFMGDDAACAVDGKGSVVLWSDAAEKTYGVSARNAVGRSFDRICEDAGWPSPARALSEALINGGHSERYGKKTAPEAGGAPGAARDELEMNIKCVYSEQNDTLGAVVFISLPAR